MPVAHTEQGFLCVLVGMQLRILVRGLAETIVANGVNSYSVDCLLHGLYLVDSRGFFHVLANCLLPAFFGLPLDLQRKIVAQLQLFLLLFRLCLCDLAWLIFHATALRKYLNTSSTVKTSSTSTYDTIL